MLAGVPASSFTYQHAQLHHADCFDWLREQPANQYQGVVTDPPYGIVEFSPLELEKLRSGKGGVWRQPPSFDGNQRAPLPRFTTLSDKDLLALDMFFLTWSELLLPTLVPGAHVLVACNALLAPRIAVQLTAGGLEYRGSVIRLVQTMRGGDRPKGAHDRYDDVSVMARSQHEPWLLLRKPFTGRVQDNLDRWGTGGLRRISADRPFGDVIASAPTRKEERALAPHPNLKPQAFMRQVVRAILPLGEGTVLDPFSGSASTLAAANAVGYRSVGVERDQENYALACEALPRLTAYTPTSNAA